MGTRGEVLREMIVCHPRTECHKGKVTPWPAIPLHPEGRQLIGCLERLRLPERIAKRSIGLGGTSTIIRFETLTERQHESHAFRLRRRYLLINIWRSQRK